MKSTFACKSVPRKSQPDFYKLKYKMVFCTSWLAPSKLNFHFKTVNAEHVALLIYILIFCLIFSAQTLTCILH